jgi:sugar-specific transcriptional regulator TrmB
MYEDILKQIGLNESEIEVYNSLLEAGILPANKISQKTNLNRTNVYNVLNGLQKKGLVEQIKMGNKTNFRLQHPVKLKELAETKAKQIIQAESVLDSVLSQIISDYNLVLGKPGVRFYEGKDGIKKVLEDSLTAKEEIYTYADIESIVKYLDDINKSYVKKRDKLGIKKKALLLDTPFSRQYLKDYYKDITDIKLIKYNALPFQTVMQIYDNKISYITLTEKNMVGIIIEDKNIYQMHKYLFEYNWQNTLKQIL